MPEDAGGVEKKAEAQRAGHEHQLTDRVVPVLRELGAPLLAALAGQSSAEGRPLRDVDAASTRSPTADSDPLLEVIETGIIPRLMLAHQAPPSKKLDAIVERGKRGLRERDEVILDAEIRERFLHAVRFEGEDSVLRIVREEIERGVPRQTVFLDLLGHTARRLGELWESDECSFVDVTIGLCRIHMVLREESALFHPDHEHRVELVVPRRRILFASGGDDQHILGLVVVAEFFRAAGWQVSCEPGLDSDAIRNLLSRTRFDVLGLTIAQSTRLHTIRAQIESFRKASLQQPLGVLVGGQIFEKEPGIADRLEVDGCCTDATVGPQIAEGLLARLRSSAPDST